MTRLLRLLLSAVLLATGAALVALPAPPAGAASLVASGWWYRASTTTPTAESPQPVPGGNPQVPALPTAPTVPADQLHVEGSPGGATAIAAMTFSLAEGESSPVLTLTPHPSSAVPPEAVILACRAAVQWAPPAQSPGTWETKPLVDCLTSVQGQTAEGGKIVFPLQPLVSGSLLDVVIVPGTVANLPAGQNGSTFSLTFARPGPEALVTTTATSGSDGGFVSPISDFSPVTETPLGGDVLDLGSPAALPTPAAEPPVAPALEPQDQAPSIPRVAAAQPVAALDRSAARNLGLVLILLGAIGAYLAANGSPRTAVGLGRFRRALPAGEAGAILPDVSDSPREVAERGLGRLRRPRVGAPPAL